MNPQDETFLVTGQESLKLEIALSRYFGREFLSKDLKERYRRYLSSRSRAALMNVLKKGNFRLLVGLAEEGFLSFSLYREAILLSADLGRTEMTVYLLRNQQRLAPETPDVLELDF